MKPWISHIKFGLAELSYANLFISPVAAWLYSSICFRESASARYFDLLTKRTSSRRVLVSNLCSTCSN
ncbi:hypothetical protein PC118_g6090 [Phytophthora cactorum]|uniref:Uncharacterized protein n=1 Tax=Phytophthora cactorum TaxID=29920 RepID=A0A8T0YG92_9STRA|nr:hypothetical protein PC111_g18200 [Phytophthora cactorum]KAG3101625.1 hypothetical protein PI125_g14407 [Phytophthora idaei]KAG2806095.1 hypothetical protein PC112_g17990 [Phytophthora cactorum]KAG2846584.1 hypothetical protein PC113_g17951 [Phytophthora cactorum]KAG2989592.1 hypothetical protein PC118_g6090 [Phytophthora cactorum]